MIAYICQVVISVACPDVLPSVSCTDVWQCLLSVLAGKACLSPGVHCFCWSSTMYACWMFDCLYNLSQPLCSLKPLPKILVSSL